MYPLQLCSYSSSIIISSSSTTTTNTATTATTTTTTTTTSALIQDANMYPGSIQSPGSCLEFIWGANCSLAWSSPSKYSELSCYQNLRVHVSKGTCSHDHLDVQPLHGSWSTPPPRVWPVLPHAAFPPALLLAPARAG